MSYPLRSVLPPKKHRVKIQTFFFCKMGLCLRFSGLPGSRAAGLAWLPVRGGLGTYLGRSVACVAVHLCGLQVSARPARAKGTESGLTSEVVSWHFPESGIYLNLLNKGAYLCNSKKIFLRSPL